MTWAKLDDGFWSHPTIDRTSLPAVGVYAKSLSYCGRHLTDGYITEEAALYMAKGKKALLRELVDQGLWQENGAGFVVPDFLDYNPSRAEKEREREEAKERMREVRGNRA